MTFYLASTNTHKAQEFAKLFDKKIIEVLPAPRAIDVEENGESFQQNAYLKASSYSQSLNAPCLADDSGLVVPKRSDILGVHSARYAPELEDYQKKCQYLLADLASLQGEDREAYFVCYLCFYLSKEEVYFFEGRLKGTIAKEVRGDAGFGYDSIFEPEAMVGQTLAQIPLWKQLNSHRAKAAHMAQAFFRERNCQKH